jgi:hypothetical protein
MTNDEQATVWLLDFCNGEARKITVEENARMAMEWQKRCTYKDGVCYVDCEPPDAA